MVSVSNIFLSISNGDTVDKKNLTVTGTNTFDTSEIGKSYRLEIKIFGEDNPDDVLPADDSIGDDQLYTFKWGFLWHKSYKLITVTAAGPQNFSEMRQVSADIVNEDSGSVDGPSPDINSPPEHFPRKDELYARVSLSGIPVSNRSPTVSPPGFGV